MIVFHICSWRTGEPIHAPAIECIETAPQGVKLRLAVAAVYDEADIKCEVYFHEADLRGAILDGLDLREAYFCDADLTGASFRNANLSGTHFYGADLVDADLRGAKARFANFEGADLRGAELPDDGASLGTAKTSERGGPYRTTVFSRSA